MTTQLMLRFCRPFLHIGTIVGSFVLMIALRQYTDFIPFVQLKIPTIDQHETLIFALIAGVMFCLIGLAMGMYELYKPIHNYYRSFMQTWMIWLVASSFVAYMWFGYIFVSGISRSVLLAAAWVSWFLVTLVDRIINAWNGYFERHSPYPVLLVGDTTSIAYTKVLDALKLYSIYAVTSLDIAEQFPTLWERDIVVVVGQVDMLRLQQIADEARISGARCYHVSDALFLEDLISVPQRIGPLMALQYKASPLDGRWRVVKRGLDFLISLLTLLILSPILLLIAIAIKLDSPGPVLYRQTRIWKNKQPFTFIKFRSMFTHLSLWAKYGGEDAAKLYQDLIASDANVRVGILSKIADDPRVTKVGKFLRLTSLDELPSLRLVLIGEMSLVWPRPHMEHEVDQYDRRQERLFSIKPGITGYAQLFGRDKLPFDEEAKLDLYYIQNRSVAMDIYVLVGTVKVVFAGK